eukprot:COSAG04_NODE_835_length_9985_cov_10.447603_2_plen_360_part_00
MHTVLWGRVKPYPRYHHARNGLGAGADPNAYRHRPGCPGGCHVQLHSAASASVDSDSVSPDRGLDEISHLEPKMSWGAPDWDLASRRPPSRRGGAARRSLGSEAACPAAAHAAPRRSGAGGRQHPGGRRRRIGRCDPEHGLHARRGGLRLYPRPRHPRPPLRRHALLRRGALLERRRAHPSLPAPLLPPIPPRADGAACCGAVLLPDHGAAGQPEALLGACREALHRPRCLMYLRLPPRSFGPAVTDGACPCRGPDDGDCARRHRREDTGRRPHPRPREPLRLQERQPRGLQHLLQQAPDSRHHLRSGQCLRRDNGPAAVAVGDRHQRALLVRPAPCGHPRPAQGQCHEWDAHRAGQWD